MFNAARLQFRSRAAEQVDLFQALSQSQKETFMALLPNWFGTVEELIEAAKLLDV
jgi:hypothetical protein